MASTCTFRHPLERDGTSQSQRLVAALRPSYVSVDERDVADLLLYARKYARLLRFYTLENQPGGDWLPFLENDVSTLVALIAATDAEATRQAFDAGRARVEAAADAAEAAEAFAGLFPLVAERAAEIDLWYRRSVDGLALRTALERVIGSVLTDALRDLISYAARAAAVGLDVAPVDTSRFDDLWKLSGVQPDPSLFPSGAVTLEEIAHAARRVEAVFGRFHDTLVYLTRSAPDFLQETLDDYPAHQPHAALFLAFLQLFGTAQRHLNSFTERHLVFYYRDVLRLDFRPPRPDSVHVVFELARNFFEHMVPAGTDLKAGKDALGNPLLYATDSDLVVSRASLDEDHGLKTIFVEKEAAGDEVVVRNIYAAPVADSADGLGAEIEDGDGKWETFGGPSMPYARVGFAVASPQLLLRQGTRTVDVTFTFASLPGLITDRPLEVAEELRHNVLVYASGEKAWLPVDVAAVAIDPAAAALRFTLVLGPDDDPVVAYDDEVLGEGLVTRHPVLKLVLDNEGFSAAGGFDLHLAEDVDPYDPAVSYEPGDYAAVGSSVFRATAASTGAPPPASPSPWVFVGSIEDYDQAGSYAAGSYVRYGGEIYEAQQDAAERTLPGSDDAVWAQIARSYPYDYFRSLSLRQLQLDVDVRGMQELILENDNGVIDPAKPFLPFGATPRVGSGFYVGSPELFGKSVEEVSLHVTWGDLPSFGFRDHYDAYVGTEGRNVFITYELRTPGQKYAAVAAAIEGLGDTAFRVQLSMWYVRTSFTAEQVRDAVWDAMDEGDTLIVVDASDGEIASEGLADAPAAPAAGNDLLIVYDLYGPGQRYGAVAAAIRGLGADARRTQPSVWRVTTTQSAEDARDAVGAEMDANDSLLVVDLTNKTVVWTGLDALEPGIESGLQASLTSTSGGGLVWGSGYFKGTFSVLHDGRWAPVAPTRRSLFETVSPGSDLPSETRTFTLGFSPALRRPDEPPTFDRFSRILQTGFLRLDLRTSFFHALYPKLVAEAAMGGGDLPNPPYTPLVTSLSVDYRAHQTVDYTRLDRHDYDARVEQFFHLHPFGCTEVYPIADAEDAGMLIRRTPVPLFTVQAEDDEGAPVTALAEGTLLVGIRGLDPPQNLSVLFQVAEGSADPEKETQDVVWSYLSHDAWVDFEDTEILADATNGLLTSGIVKLAMPKAMTDDHTILPSGLYWIKASVAEETEAVSKLIDVRPQAVRATFEDHDNDPNHLAEALPADTIAKLDTRLAAVKSVSQPYASFGGRMKERGEAFYTRVSERLRHKQRAVSIFDYERLVLEAFPDVYKVKCITHTDKNSEHVPGAVRVIAVPNLRNKNAVDPLQPRVSKNTLEEIQALLAGHATDFADVYVTNPKYEQVRVAFKVAFHPGKDVGYHLNLLEEDVIKHLSPWLYKEGADLAFGGRIHRSWILNYVEERPYVDYVTDFTMHHIVDGTTYPNVEEARATTAGSVLVSSAEHDISELNLAVCPTPSS